MADQKNGRTAEWQNGRMAQREIGREELQNGIIDGCSFCSHNITI
jgi:hypothetical protein